MMGTCKAPIYQLLPSSTQPAPTLRPPPPPLKPNKFQIPETTRRGLLLSLPIFAATTSFLNGTTTSTNDFTTSSLCGFARAANYYDPLTQAEKDASTAISLRVNKALELLEKGKELQAVGDFNKALLYFTMVVENYKDFAFSEYARVGRAIALYEVGDREEAIAEMEDVSISLKGYPEVHAALAAALYQDKHAPLLAENQFTIATLLDPHYTDLSYVKQTKHWPPSLVDSLQHFINLS